MNITNKQLRKIIKEELDNFVLRENDLYGDTAASAQNPEDDKNSIYGKTNAAEQNPEDDKNSIYGKTNAPQEKQNLETRLAQVENVLKQLIAKLKK
jgi:hypothetical protein|tara:strand:+ start:76 stop:363 length:288 start_codon:yes stop_codon:yes gene_type:complete